LIRSRLVSLLLGVGLRPKKKKKNPIPGVWEEEEKEEEASW